MRGKKVLFNIISNLLLQVVIVIYGFIVPKVIISNFGSNVNGLISSITQFLGYISLLESGFGPVVKAALYKPIVKKDKNAIANILINAEKFFKSISLIFIFYMIALCLIYPLLVNKNFDYLYTVSLIIIISISIFSEYFFGMTYKLYLQADQKTYIISIIQIFTYILSTVAIIILAICGSTIHLLKFVSGLIFTIRPVVQNIYVKRKYNINLKNVNYSKNQLKQKWDGLAQHIAAVIHGSTDTTVLTIFCPLTEVSVYSIYYLVVRGVVSIIQAFSSGIDALFGNMLANGEQENLNEKFKMYEVMYFTIITIIFSCTILLIVPFITVYTKGINDANYIRKSFGYLIVISEYIWAIRLPYSSIVLAAGHFKETKIGAWIETISNIIISVILVNRFGINGVAIGTIIAMTIRTIEFIYHSNKYILQRNILSGLKNIFIIILETILIIFILSNISIVENTSYINWIVNAIITFAITSITTFFINYLFFKNEFNELFKIVKNIFNKRKV